MYLKTLTLRGFKSFASATTLRLEPGITCVVGPNGSGKSNIVDALSWVMGEQGAKSLRGGKMEDVVFAGTSTRAPLGRAEVSLTIDNSDGALPIDYAEVTISRLMFRSGQSEYAINGDSCRLLDVQDLLSDSGLGREMHVIVGQGQLDQVLHAGPEARRAIIEEAAGVLKHRRRKEKALRKLDAMQANLTRLVDLTAELNRRLKPLGRQAEVARRASIIQAELRDARLRLLADDYVTLRDRLQREEADETAIRARRTGLEADLTAARQQEEELDRAAADQAAELAQAQHTWFALSSLTERMRAVASLAAERSRLLSADTEPERPGRDPEELERQAAELRDEETGLAERMAEGRAVLSEVIAERSAAESALAGTERRIADEARAAAGRAERLARLRGMADAAASRSAATAEEIERLAVAAEQARARAEKARLEYSEVQDLVDGQSDDRSGLATGYEQAAAAHKQATDRVTAARKAERQANSEASALRARAEALEETLRRGADATAVVLASPDRFTGVLGAFAGQLVVADGFETAIAAALGAAAEAVTVGGLDAAVSLLTEIRAADAGTMGLVIATVSPRGDEPVSPRGDDPPVGPPAKGGDPLSPPSQGNEQNPLAPGLPVGVMTAARPALPDGVRWGLDLVTAPAELGAALAEILGDVVVVADLATAGELVTDHEGLKAVTMSGDLLGAHWAYGGSARKQTLLDVRAAADEAAAKFTAAVERAEEAGVLLAEATEAQEAAQATVDEMRRQMQTADAAAAEVSGRLGRLAGAARAATDEAGRLDASVGAARRSAEQDLAKLARLRSELEEAEADQERASDPGIAAEQAEEVRAELAQRATVARDAEMEARLEVRTVEERLRAISGRADSLSAAAAAERTARERAVARRRQRAEQASVARAVAIGAGVAVSAAESSLASALARREAAEQLTATGAGVLRSVRTRVTALAAELDQVVNTAHGTEIARAEHRLRLEQMEAHAIEEYGVEPLQLIAEYGPDVLVPTADATPADGTPADGTPADGIPAPAGDSPAAAEADAAAANAAAANAAAANAAATNAAGIDAVGAAVAGSAAPQPAIPPEAETAAEAEKTAAVAKDAVAAPAAGSLAEALRAVTEAARAESNGAAATGPDGPAASTATARPRRKKQEEPPMPAAVPYVREEQERRAAEAEKQMARLGKVNPLALEEFAALQERHQFLATQLEDLRKTRRDLLTVVKEVDDRVQEVFSAAYADTAREFEGLFGRLFPGGSGRLILTEPDDMLTTGIEVEARPPGKKVKRLSLLSGGERSLTAIAYLFAIFKARPSPFYVLDEVEAALDDSNLQRLLRVFEEVREASQLIVITHQRRTMEAADALYGVSMRGDGVSMVIGQRVREPELA
ncbi:MAG: chromosome segregation protein [Actinomycetia bacterium]|nr:chromosome segregation protein [Actinomycetes bacterium]